MSSAISSQSPNPLSEKVTRALTLARELSLALIICYKMPNSFAVEGGVKQVTDMLRRLAENIEHRHVEFEAGDVVVEKCFDALFDAQEVIEGFLDAEDQAFREELKRKGQ